MISSPGISRKFSIKHLIHCFIIRCRQCPRAMAEPTTRIYCYILDCFPLSPACRTRTSTSACFRKRKRKKRTQLDKEIQYIPIVINSPELIDLQADWTSGNSSSVRGWILIWDLSKLLSARLPTTISITFE